MWFSLLLVRLVDLFCFVCLFLLFCLGFWLVYFCFVLDFIFNYLFVCLFLFYVAYQVFVGTLAGGSQTWFSSYSTQLSCPADSAVSDDTVDGAWAALSSWVPKDPVNRNLCYGPFVCLNKTRYTENLMTLHVLVALPWGGSSTRQPAGIRFDLVPEIQSWQWKKAQQLENIMR